MAYPGADADTDHSMVIMKTDLNLKKIIRNKAIAKWNPHKLNNEQTKTQY